MLRYVIYGIYGIYNMILGFTTIGFLAFAHNYLNPPAGRYEFPVMMQGDNLFNIYILYPVYQIAILHIAAALPLVLFYFVNQMYLTFVANAADPKRTSFHTVVVSAAMYSGVIVYIQFHSVHASILQRMCC